MLEFVILIILLPLAVIMLTLMAFGVFLVWEYIVAAILWLSACVITTYGLLTHQISYGWIIGLLIAGWLFWPSSKKLKRSIEDQKEHHSN
jgi:hypothetical protein